MSGGPIVLHLALPPAAAGRGMAPPGSTSASLSTPHSVGRKYTTQRFPAFLLYSRLSAKL